MMNPCEVYMIDYKESQRKTFFKYDESMQEKLFKYDESMRGI